MSVQVETLDKNMAKLTIEVPADELEKALNQAYNHQKNRISMPGFRKGKVPRALIEREYGPEVFYDDAANILIQQEYPKVFDEVDLDIVSSPEVDVVNIKKGENFVFTATVATKPEVELGKYSGVTVTKIDTSVSDQEVDDKIEQERKNNSRAIESNEPAKMGDTVVIDFDGSIDGVPFDGGKAENYTLELGSHSFIDNFEDQLAGHNAGDDVDVNVTFPADYQEASLAGKPALFKCRIHSVMTKELPELNDEFASDVSEFETLEEYKADIRSKLEKDKENSARRTKEDEAIAKIVEHSKMDIPAPMIDTQVSTMINEYAQSLMQSGLSFQQYLQFTGSTMDQFREQVRPDAEERIKSSLVLEAIAKAENLEATDEDVEKKIAEMAETYGMKVEDLKENIPDSERSSMKDQIAIEKAVDFIMDNVKERAKPKKKAEPKKDQDAEKASEEKTE